jgi:2-phospho-L-lactate/phosphoenolpyruvate guanylyltransferase
MCSEAKSCPFRSGTASGTHPGPAGRIAAVGGDARPGWAVVLPVKRLSAGKSRLRGALPGVPHERLALALAADTVAAAVACPEVAEVLVVTDDPAAAEALAALGARIVPDVGGGLNAAFGRGAAAVRGRPVAALAGDLPALRPADLSGALRAAEPTLRRFPAEPTMRRFPAEPTLRRFPAEPTLRRFAADAAGTGTVLLTAPSGGSLDPRFGPASAAAHAASGALPLAGALPRLRRDVDTAEDLAAAAALGLGPHTAALVAMAGNGRYGAAMQGTVATFDPATRSGTLLLDDGTELPYPASAFDASGLRLLRLGQRVRVDRDPSGSVVKITIPTFG